MGAYDGAEVCELVALYILYKLEQVIHRDDMGLYRDDGLAAVRGSRAGETAEASIFNI